VALVACLFGWLGVFSVECVYRRTIN
jgi:hypothetical protein